MKRRRSPILKRFKRGAKTRESMFTLEDLRAVEFLSKLGATVAQFAQFFNVHRSTVEGWMKNYPEFQTAMKRGGMIADMKVAQSLYKRATGYAYIETEYSAVEVNGEKIPLDEMAQVKRVKKVMPPDVKAATLWLRNRQREIWSVAPEMIHRHTGKVDHLHRRLQDIPVQELSSDAQKLLFEITQKQLTVGNHETNEN